MVAVSFVIGLVPHNWGSLVFLLLWGVSIEVGGGVLGGLGGYMVGLGGFSCHIRWC